MSASASRWLSGLAFLLGAFLAIGSIALFRSPRHPPARPHDWNVCYGAYESFVDRCPVDSDGNEDPRCVHRATIEYQECVRSLGTEI